MHRTRTIGVRPAGGFIERAYTSNYFGSSDSIDKAQGRSGLEAGVLCAQVGLFSGKGKDGKEAARGWSSMVSLGANLGIPGRLVCVFIAVKAPEQTRTNEVPKRDY